MAGLVRMEKKEALAQEERRAHLECQADLVYPEKKDLMVAMVSKDFLDYLEGQVGLIITKKQFPLLLTKYVMIRTFDQFD